MIIDATKASSMIATENGFPQRRLVKMRSAFESTALFFFTCDDAVEQRFDPLKAGVRKFHFAFRTAAKSVEFFRIDFFRIIKFSSEYVFQFGIFFSVGGDKGNDGDAEPF